jgi:hypothetical protein
MGGEMLSKKERWIYFYETILKPYPDNAPTIRINDVINDLYERWQANQCVKIINKGTAAIRISDMRIDRSNNLVSFLFQYADKDISDPSFLNLLTGALRTEPKSDEEGVAVSSHMIISLQEKDGLLSKYETVLEDVPGLGRSKIEPFLQSEFKIVSKDNLYFLDDGIRKQCRPMVEINGVPSQSLKEDLERGVLDGIELVKHHNGESEFDEPEFIKDETYSVFLSVSRTSGNAATALLNRLKNKAKTLNYDQLVVRYKRNQGDNGKQKSIRISTAREDAADSLYTKFEIIKSSTPLPQCSPEILDSFANKMISLM